VLQFPPHPTSVFALPGESRPSIIRVKINEKTSINAIYPNLWATITGILQGLTVMQHCVYQTKFRNVCEVKKRPVQPGLVWSRTLSILLSVNGENVSLPVFA